MRQVFRGICGVAILLLVVGCGGGPSEAERKQERETQATLLAGEVHERQQVAAQAAARVEADACKGQIGDLIDAISELDSRLDVGMVFRDYTSVWGSGLAAQQKDVAETRHENGNKALGPGGGGSDQSMFLDLSAPAGVQCKT
ncbi:MAG: hypothetical protein ACRDQ2_11200 [Gaiellales bacterium]